MNINKVGKRWFIVKGEGIDVEASYGEGYNVTVNDDLSKEAGYTAYDWKPARKWNLTGKGAKKYRTAIILELEESLNPCIKATESPSDSGSRKRAYKSSFCEGSER